MKLSNELEIVHIPDLSGITEEQKQHCQEWITALRSKTYAQGFGNLVNVSNHYCCLGVAQDLRAKKGLGTWMKRYSFKENTSNKTPNSNNLVLTSEAVKYYGLKNLSGFSVLAKQSNGNERFELTELNDNQGATFDDIASIIEVAINGGLI